MFLWVLIYLSRHDFSNSTDRLKAYPTTGSRPADGTYLDHVHLVAGAAFGADAVAADAGNDQTMTGNTELVLAAELVAKLLELLVLKFEQFVALGAMEVIVLRIAVVMLIDRAAIEDKLAQ